MYDTIRAYFELINGEIPSILRENLIEVPINKLGDCKYYLENFYCRIKETRIYLSGSLSRLLFGNNLRMLSYEETNQAIEHLCSKIGLEASNIKLTSVDFAFNILTEKKVKHYLSYFGEFGNKKKKEYAKAVQYDIERLSLQIYDKAQQMRNNKSSFGNVPSNLLNANIMRIELKLRSLNHYLKFGIKLHSFDDLMKQETYMKLFELLRNNFLEIQKKKVALDGYDQKFKFSDISTLKYLMIADYLADEAKKTIWLDTINYIHTNGGMSDTTYWRYRKYIKESTNLINSEYLISPLQELEDKVVSIEPPVSKTRKTWPHLYYF